MDKDGYPTEEELKYIKEFDVVESNWHGLMYYIKTEVWWHGGSLFTVKEMEWEYHISTGGWSGNEEVIEALKSKHMFWIMYWQQSTKGGHYIFSKSGL